MTTRHVRAASQWTCVQLDVADDLHTDPVLRRPCGAAAKNDGISKSRTYRTVLLYGVTAQRREVLQVASAR